MEQTFGKFLTEKRKENHLTQKALAEKLFVTESAVNKWEKDVSHPDITLLPKLAELLGVTEHELITASTDLEHAKNIKQAKKWKTLTTTWNLIFYIGYGITLLTCFICDLAINKTLTWFWVVLSSLLLSASFTTIPQFIKNKRIVYIPLINFTCLTILLLVCNIYSNGNWFLIAILPIILSYLIIFLPILIAKLNLPQFIKRNNAFISITVDYIFITLMLFIYNIIFNGNWFKLFALPITSILFVFSLITAILCKTKKLNTFFKTGIIIEIWTLLFNFSNYIVDHLMNIANITGNNSSSLKPFSFNLANWGSEYISNNISFIIFLSLTFIALLFIIFGFIAKNIKIKSKTSQH